MKIRSPLVAAATIVAAALLGLFLAQGFYWARAATVVEFDRPTSSALLRGFFPAERAPDGLTFAWTRQRAELRLPGLDRRVAWQVRVRLRGARADTSTLPEVTLLIDGRPAARTRVTNTFEELGADVEPARGGRGLSVGLDVSNTFRPGPQDRRDLGVTVDRLAVEPGSASFVRAPNQLLVVVSLVAALVALTVAGLGFGALTTIAAAAVVGAGASAALTSGSAAYVTESSPLVPLAAVLTLATVVPARVAATIRRAPVSVAIRAALGISAAALFLKLLVLWHPDVLPGDALFHAHRFQWVLGGRYIFTSIAPGGYQFPYGIALYLTALPFVTSPGDTAGLVHLLRGIVAACDALAGLVLSLAVTRSTRDGLAGVLAVALYHLVPLNMQVQLVANLTNMFGQSFFVIAVALVSLGWASRGSWVRSLVAMAVTAWAMLAHLSTFSILGVLLVLLAALWARSERQEVRRLALPLLIVTGLAAAIAVATYYGHFGDTYRAVFARISGELAQPIEASDPRGRSLADRLAYVPYVFTISLGWAAVALACAGALRLRRADADLLPSTMGAWSLACAVFLAIGVLTPIDMRHYLAWFPALSALAAVGASWAWRGGVAARVAAVSLVGWTAWLGVAQWLAGLG